MSFTGDVLTALEARLRTAVPSLPAGTLGVERDWRPVDQIEPGALPHVFLFNVTERQETLIFLQAKSQVQLTGLIVRRDSTYAQALEDYEALSDVLEADPTMAGVVEQSELSLDGVEDEEGGKHRGVAFSFTGWKVLS